MRNTKLSVSEFRRLFALVIVWLFWAAAAMAQPASRPNVDAPELAKLGRFAVGVQTLKFVQTDQPNVLGLAPSTGIAPLADRVLLIDIWYPAKADQRSPVVYSAALPSETPGQAVAFTSTGLALRDAAPVKGRYPLVILSHGYSNSPVMMSWLAENLASKGYIVAGIHHEDPPITDGAKFFGPLVRRPLDIVFVANELQRRAGSAKSGIESLIDAHRVALIGYSMGGYGVLTVGGAGLAPEGVAAAVPGGAMAPYVRGGAKEGELRIAGLQAVVALSPAGGGHGFSAWGATGLEQLRKPLLLISGDKDETVGYADGVRPIFDQAIHSPRYLLVFNNASHSIGVNPAPPNMRSRLWDLDWFEDPVWRKERVIAINLHIITAFLDLYVRGDASRIDYLRPSVARSNDTVWPLARPAPYDAFSSGNDPITVWKGFQRRHIAGLELLHAEPAPLEMTP